MRGNGPMDCETVGKLLQRYLDGELDAPRGQRLAAHLEVCRHCGLDADAYTQVKTALANSSAMPPAIVARLQEFGRSLLHHDHPSD
jgi:anti-sigma factor RsiW